MTVQWQKAALFILVVGMTSGLCSIPVAVAQVIHPDQIIGEHPLQSETITQDAATFNEPVAGDLDRGSDQQMVTPDTGSFEGMDTSLLRTPDAIDAENARESDSQSAVSF